MAATSRKPGGPPAGGPLIIIPPLWVADATNPGHPLSEAERALLAVIASVVRFRKGERIFGEGERVTALFNIVSGVVKSWRLLPDNSRHVAGFLFPNDVVGLALNGVYVNSAEAVTPVIAYRIPTAPLEARMRQYPGLDFQLIAKLCHDLREAQRHALLLSRHHAVARIGLFIQMLESHQLEAGGSSEIYLPMSRAEIGGYAGISPEAVSRALHQLEASGAIRFQDHRHLRIADRARLEAAIADTGRW